MEPCNSCLFVTGLFHFMISKFLYGVAGVRVPSCLRQNNIPLYGETVFCLTMVYQESPFGSYEKCYHKAGCIGICSGPCFQIFLDTHPEGELLDLMEKISEGVSRSLVSLHSFGLQPTRLLCPWDSLGANTGVGCHAFLQGIFPTQGLNPGLLQCWWILYHMNHHMVIPCLILGGTSILLFTTAVPFYIPTSSIHGFQCLHILPSACYFLLFVLIAVRGYCIAVLICVSLMITDVEHLPMNLLASVYLQRNVY